MRGVAKERGVISEKQPFKCGAQGYIFAPKSYSRSFFCKKWTCEKCRNRRIKSYENILKATDLAVTSYVSQRPPVATNEEKKALDNFLSRQIRGQYWTVRSDERIVIITKCKHPNAVRLQSKYIIETLVVDILNEPWKQSFSQRFTKSREQNEIRNKKGQQVKTKVNKKTEDTAYAKWKRHDDPNGEAALIEFNKLKTDHGRAEWLIQHESEVVLYNRGREIIGQYHAEAAPPRSAAGILYQCTV